ncbi:unnamed protein product [Caenorhabditis angaria]|uniref:Uncharacterized protein n=1 Tax=Caenorhabditis angaria TaxID=860376 RepID=A0A9P1IRM0_9PELO|nr:unnamed protein product [Caenorhabditis angaria]
MQFSIIAFLLLLIPLSIFANFSEDDSDLTPSERFARDLELRKKFAFAFAKRSSGSGSQVPDEVLIEARSGTPKDMRFAFAKRRAAKEFARFARASFA